MKNKEKFIQLFFIIVIVAGLAAVPMMIIGEQRASVPAFFWSSNNTNETVLRAQNKLTELGLYTGNLSGLFGIRTRSAIIQFQEENNLVVNGILDIPTQQLLFSIEPDPGYQIISHTEGGNQYLLQWINYMYGQSGKKIELRGNLTLGDIDMFYGDVEETVTRFVLEVDGTEYAVMNISGNNLGQFVGEQVRINGFYIGDSSLEGVPMVIINYVNEGEDGETPIFIDYTLGGNNYLRKWIRKVYQEEVSLVGLSGVLSIGETVQYGPNGHSTDLVLTAQDGVQYSLENISSDTAVLSMLNGQEIMIRGAILANTNSLGMKTVVINYVLDLGDLNPAAAN